MSTRAWKMLAYDAPYGPVSEAVLRFAIVLWCRDEASGLSDVQVDWLRTRIADIRRFTPPELGKIVPKLLAWSEGKGCQATLVKGLRGVVDEGLLPEEQKS